MQDKLIINKKNLKGEDGYKTFSIRIKEDTVVKLNKLSDETNRSRNELINILLEYAIDNSKVYILIANNTFFTHFFLARFKLRLD